MPSIYLNKNRNKYLSEELSILSDCANPTLRWILSGFDDFEKRIDEIKKSWSPKVREFYRDVLNLKTKKNPIKTIYRLDNNGKFIRLIEENFPDLNFSELISLQQFLHELNHVKPYYTSDNARKSLLYAENYALAKLKKYNLEEIIKTLFNLHKRTPEDDVFGSYFYKQHTVEIYVIPCIIFSMIIKEDFQDMLIGTLAHELAHAFHHIGEDKDGYTWETMPNIELSLVEGLAEYYTCEFAKSVNGQKLSDSND